MPANEHSRDPAGQGASSSEGFDQLLSEYVDRLTGGEELNPFDLLAAHPEHGPEILRHLEAYAMLESDQGEPLGTLGDYTLRRQIGRGGMGVVYEAWENSMDRVVALKVLPAGIAADTRACSRFMREAQAAGKLSHPNVVPVFFMGVKEQTPFYAMEFIEGETLAQVLGELKNAEPATETPFGRRDDTRYFANLAEAFADVADGLQHAHSKGVVHRDIKPSNLILDLEGRLRILDFGLATLEGQEGLTISGDVVGTPLYMSPEQARRRKVTIDHRTDVYSLGATMYETLCGKPPFRGKDHADTLSQIIERDAAEPRKVNSRVSKDFETIVLKCLRKDAGDRYGTAEALGQDLRRFVRGDPVEARPEGRLERIGRRVRRHRVLLVTSAVFVLALVMGLMLAVNLRRQYQQERVARYEQLLVEGMARLQVREVSGVGGWPGGRFQEYAVDHLRNAAEVLPNRPEAWWQLSRALESLGRPLEARDALDRALATAPDFVPALMAKLRAVHAEDPKDDVTKELEILRSGCRERWQRLSIEASIAALRSDSESVEKTYGDLLTLGREREPYYGFVFEHLLLRGQLRFELNRFIAALLDFHEARSRVGEVLLADLLLASTYYALESDDEARELLAKTQSRFTGSGAALAIAGIALRFRDVDRALAVTDDLPAEDRLAVRMKILRRAERFEDAIETGLAAISSRVQPVSVYDDTANSLIDMKRVDEAESIAREGLRAYPKDRLLEGFLYRYMAYRRCRHQDAVDYQLSLPPNERNWRSVGWNQYRLGRYEEAVAAFSTLIHDRPDDAHAWHSRAWAHLRNGYFEPAVADWLEAAHHSSGTHFLTIWSLAKLHDSPSRRGALQSHWTRIDRALSTPEARRQDNALWLGLRALAAAYRPASDLDEALLLARRAVDKSRGRDGQALSRLAEVRFARGEIADAIVTLERALGARNCGGTLVDQLTSYREQFRPALASCASIDVLVAGLGGSGIELRARDRERTRSWLERNSPKLATYLEATLLQADGDSGGATSRLEALVLGEELVDLSAVIRLARLWARAGRRDEALTLIETRALPQNDATLFAWEAWLEIGSRSPALSPGALLARLGKIQGWNPAEHEDYGFRDDIRVVLEQLAESGAIRINCGGEDMNDAEGHPWLSDRFFEGGDPGFRFAPPIQGTEDDPLFTQQRAFWMDFELAPGYRVPCPDGKYELALLFVVSVGHPQPIRFAIECEGRVLESDFAMNDAGFGVAQRRTYRVSVEGGSLDLVLRPKSWISIISGIEIRRIY